MRILNLLISNYRNHSNINIATSEENIIVITGKNGSGKTSILEAISILYPGKGIRSAKLAETIRKNSERAIIRVKIINRERITEIQTQIDTKKNIEINGKKIKSHQEIAEALHVIWFSPQICSLLISSNAARIKFIDRIAYSTDSAHAKLIIEYKKATQTRNNLLINNNKDNVWLSSLEKIIAQNAILIHKNRAQVIDILTKSSLITAKITMQGKIANLISSEDENNNYILEQKLKECRKIDSLYGLAKASIYKNPINIINLENNYELNSCSTGEQKNLILSIVMAQIRAQYIDHRPIILLDDPMAHLDNHKRDTLLAELKKFDCQIWIADHNPNNYNSKDIKIFELK